MFTFQSSSQNIIVLVIKLLLSAMSSSSIWSILMLWLVLCQPPFFASWLPIRFCHRDTRASAKKQERGERNFVYLFVCSCWHCSSLGPLYQVQQQSPLVPRFFTPLRSGLDSKVSIPAGLPPSGSGPSYTGVFFEVPEINVNPTASPPQILWFQICRVIPLNC